MAASQGPGDMTGAPPSSGVKASLAILVAEDSVVTQELLKLLLTQRRHSVDIFDDGEKALRALQGRNYDIALMDFHLPKMDGLRVVAEYKSLVGPASKQTRFIGITGDVEGFMAHPNNWETFDLVIANPIDIVHLCGVVENFERYLAWRSDTAIGGGAPQPTPVVLADDGSSAGNGSGAGSVGAGNDRLWRDKRMKVERDTTEISLGNGQVFTCRVLDLSLSGAGLLLDARPPVGERVRIGRTEGRIVRHTSDGIAVEFTRRSTC